MTRLISRKDQTGRFTDKLNLSLFPVLLKCFSCGREFLNSYFMDRSVKYNDFRTVMASRNMEGLQNEIQFLSSQIAASPFSFLFHNVKYRQFPGEKS